MNHTTEPWEIAGDSIVATGLNEMNSFLQGEVCIANIETDGGYEADAETRDANKKRIVECVNACAGMKDPTATLQGIRDALRFVIHNHNLDGETCMEKINEAYLSLI